MQNEVAATDRKPVSDEPSQPKGTFEPEIVICAPEVVSHAGLRENENAASVQGESINALAGTPSNQEALIEGDTSAGQRLAGEAPGQGEDPLAGESVYDGSHSQGDNTQASAVKPLHLDTEDPIVESDAAVNSDGGRGEIPKNRAESVDGERADLGANTAEACIHDDNKPTSRTEPVPQIPPESEIPEGEAA